MRGESSIIEGGAISVLMDDMPHDGLHEPFLEVERRLHTYEGQLKQAIAQAFGQPGDKAFQHQGKLSVVQQVVKRLLHLARLIRSYFVKLREPTQALPKGGMLIC